MIIQIIKKGVRNMRSWYVRKSIAILCFLVLIAGSCLVPGWYREVRGAQGVPTDNPAASMFGAATYTWTDGIRWNNVKNILDFGGKGDSVTDNVYAFNAARDAAASEGGGVVFFPSGTYLFSDSIYLTHGVVIRGETPVGTTSAKDSNYNPPTNFEFPKYIPVFSGNGADSNTAFKIIGTIDPVMDSNTGIVNVDVNRARILLDGSFDYLGKKEIGTGKNRLVIGVRITNAIGISPEVPKLDYQNAWQRFTNRFTAAIKVNTYENALVANNRIANGGIDPETVDDSFVMENFILKNYNNAATPYTIKFDYHNRYGIAVNRMDVAFVNGSFMNPDRVIFAATPESDPHKFRKGIDIRDNFVYHNGRVGIIFSGDGTIVSNNVTRIPMSRHSEMMYTTSGQGKIVTGSVTNEFRGIDCAGYNYVVENNDLEIYNAPTPDGHYSTDGEGILHQESDSTDVVNATIRNNKINAYIGIYKTHRIEGLTIMGNILDAGVNSPQAHTTRIYVNANTNAAWFPAKNVTISNNIMKNSTDIYFNGSVEGMGNSIRDNIGEGGMIMVDTQTKAILSGNTGFVPNNIQGRVIVSNITSNAANVSWKDVSLNGVSANGYYIEKKKTDNTWDLLAKVPQGTVTDVVYNITNLTANTKHDFRIRPYNSNGENMDGTTFSLTTAPTGAVNQTGVLRFASPASGSTYTAGDIPFVIEASDNENISRIDLYVNQNRVTNKTGINKSTYTFSDKWGSAPAGNHMLTAVMTDSKGATVSARVYLNVTANSPIMVANAINDQVIDALGVSRQVDVSNTFQNTDQHSFTVTAVSNRTSVAAVDYNSGSKQLNINPVGEGTALINVRASDGYREGSADTWFTVINDVYAPVWPSESILQAFPISSSSVRLDWTPAQDTVGIKGYRVFVNNAPYADCSGGVTTCLVAGLNPGSVYDLRVEAADATGRWTDKGPLLKIFAPTAPKYLKAISVQDTVVELSWEASNDNTGIKQYVIFNGTTQVGVVDQSTYTYTLNNLKPLTEYILKVAAVDEHDHISEAGIIKVVTLADTHAPSAPGNLRAAYRSENYIKLQWDASVDNVSVAEYRIYLADLLVGTTKETSYTVTALTAATEYSFIVIASDEADNLSASSSLSTRTKVNLVTVQKLLEQFIAVKEVNGPLADQTANNLDQAVHQWDKGDGHKAAKHLEDLIKHLNNENMQSHVSSQAKAALLRDVQELIETLSGR